MWKNNLLSTVLCASSVTACFQELDTGAARVTTETPTRDENAPPTTVIEDPEIGLDPDDETLTTRDPCEKTSRDALQILDVYCGNCHAQGPASVGVPRFDFVLDTERMLSSTWTVGDEQRRFLIAGDAFNSWVYRRTLLGTMPPVQTDIRNDDYPRPTISDLSVLEQWINFCVGAAGEPPPVVEMDNARFHFEEGPQGWTRGSPSVASVGTSTERSYAGIASLACTVSSTAASTHQIEVENPPPMVAGSRITLHVFLPSDAPISSIQPYVVDQAGVNTGSLWMYPTTGEWVQLRVVVPTSTTSTNTISRLGLEITSDQALDDTIYIDSINW